MGIHSLIPDNEPQRMAAVKRYDILDTPPDGSFDRITAIAARRFNVPISIISIVDHDRIWFKSHYGVPVEQIGRDPGLCASAILSPEPHILPDAKVDPRSLANPLVAGDFGLRFYAGVPLRTSDGYNLGTLCIIDKEVRPINQAEIDELKDLASLVMDHMELRLSARQAVSRAEIMGREIDHRVKNSLQFISAMLNMQGRLPDLPPAASKQLQMAAHRVTAVARVHENFYADAAVVSCVAFLRRLCADLSDILGKPITVEGDEGEVQTVHIQPIGSGNKYVQGWKITTKHVPRPAGLAVAVMRPPSWSARTLTTLIPRPLALVSGSKPIGSPSPSSQTLSWSGISRLISFGHE